MKKPPCNGMAISKSLYDFEEGVKTDYKIVIPINLRKKLPALSMGNYHRDAKSLSILLQNIQYSNHAYNIVLSSLERKYRARFIQGYNRLKKQEEV